MLVQLECPWCNEALSVDADRLDEPVRCAACSVRFSFAEEVAAVGPALIAEAA